MKKKMVLTGVVCASLFLTACATSDTATTQSNTTTEAEVTTEAVTQAATKEEQTEQEVEATKEETEVKETEAPDTESRLTEGQIRKIFDNNLTIVLSYYQNPRLTFDIDQEATGIYPIEDSAFASYADFETLIKNTYTDDAAKILLQDGYPSEGKVLFLEQDGKLCINLDNELPRGYFIDWSDYTITGIRQENDTITFTATGAVTEPGDNVDKEAHPVEAKLVNVDGSWKLANLYY